MGFFALNNLECTPLVTAFIVRGGHQMIRDIKLFHYIVKSSDSPSTSMGALRADLKR